MRRLAPLALAVSAAACARNLDLPQDRGAPSVSGLTPTAAYAGELVTVSGSGFDPDPSRNQVQFASGASAAGLAVGAGSLQVRVPRAAGSGPITVSNAAGPGVPSGAFQYLGGGELLRGAARTPRVPSHAPLGIAATAGDIFVESSLWGGIVSMLDRRFDGDGGEHVVSLGGGSAVAWLHRASREVIRQEVPTLVPGSPVRITAGYGGQFFVRLARIAAFGARPETLALLAYDVSSPPARMLLTTYDATTLAVYEATRQLSLDDFWALQDGGRGRVAVHGVRSGVDGLYLIAPGLPDRWAPAPASLAGEATQPLAVATLPSGHYVAAFLDRDSNLRTIDLDGAGLVFDARVIETRALVEFASGLAAAGPWLAVSKRTENLVLGIDLAAGSIGWSVSTPSPGPATSDGIHFQVASLVPNDALEIDASSGVVQARRDLGLFPGLSAIVGGLGFCAAARCGVDELHVATSYPSGVLLTTPTGAQAWGNDTGRGTTDPTGYGVAVSQGVQWTWGDKWVSDSSSGALMTVSGSILGLVGKASAAWVVHGDGLSRLVGGVVLGTSPFTPAEVQGPLDLPGGRAAVAWREVGATAWQVSIVSEAQAAAGIAPRPLGLARPATALFLLDGVAWVAYGGSAGGSFLAAVDALQDVVAAAPRAATHVPLDFTLSHVVAQSPNGQMLVQVWPGTGDIYLVRADPQASFPLLATISVDGQVTGFTFDESGETAYVVTRIPERLVALE